MPICLLLSTALLLVPNLLAKQTSSQAAAVSSAEPTHDVATPLPTYDVVSIHEHKPGTNDLMSMGSRDAGFTARNMNLNALLVNAYKIRILSLISGLPSWSGSTSFDISAKVRDPDIDILRKLTPEQRCAMLIALLADRFHLRAHIVTKTLPVYDLVLAKGGPKLKENTAPTGPHNMPGSMTMSRSQITAVGVPTSNIAANLANQTQRNVIDKTGLTGRYDFTLKWTPTEFEGKTDNNDPDGWLLMPTSDEL
jgi:uncharacterized protein (TIGR03435 family)